MTNVKIIGGAVTKFGRHMDRNMKSLAAEAVNNALKDAGLSKEQLEGAWVGNSAQGLLDGQEMIRGQVVLYPMGIRDIPIFNLESACASSAAAFNNAWARVSLGEIDVALVLGMEKMFCNDKKKSLQVIASGMDVERWQEVMEAAKKAEEEINQERLKRGEEKPEKTQNRSIIMDMYSQMARDHMKKYGTTKRQIASVSSKNHFHSSMNPLAQYRRKNGPLKKS